MNNRQYRRISSAAALIAALAIIFCGGAKAQETAKSAKDQKGKGLCAFSFITVLTLDDGAPANVEKGASIEYYNSTPERFDAMELEFSIGAEPKTGEALKHSVYFSVGRPAFKAEGPFATAPTITASRVSEALQLHKIIDLPCDINEKVIAIPGQIENSPTAFVFKPLEPQKKVVLSSKKLYTEMLLANSVMHENSVIYTSVDDFKAGMTKYCDLLKDKAVCASVIASDPGVDPNAVIRAVPKLAFAPVKNPSVLKNHYKGMPAKQEKKAYMLKTDGMDEEAAASLIRNNIFSRGAERFVFFNDLTDIYVNAIDIEDVAAKSHSTVIKNPGVPLLFSPSNGVLDKKFLPFSVTFPDKSGELLMLDISSAAKVAAVSRAPFISGNYLTTVNGYSAVITTGNEAAFFKVDSQKFSAAGKFKLDSAATGISTDGKDTFFVGLLSGGMKAFKMTGKGAEPAFSLPAGDKNVITSPAAIINNKALVAQFDGNKSTLKMFNIADNRLEEVAAINLPDKHIPYQTLEKDGKLLIVFKTLEEKRLSVNGLEANYAIYDVGNGGIVPEYFFYNPDLIDYGPLLANADGLSFIARNSEGLFLVILP